DRHPAADLDPAARRRGDRVKRREFITLLGGAAATWPQAAPLGVAFAQSNERVRVGYLWIGAEGSDGQTLRGVRQGLADVGLVEGRNLVIERRYAHSHPERLSALAMELVRLDVAVLLAPGAVVTRAARSATETIPIVSVTNDPVALGFAQSLARPGGNVTGMAITASDQLVWKWIELLKDVTPALKRAALLYDPRPAPLIERVAHDASVTIWVPHWQPSRWLDPMVCSSATTRYCFLRGASLLHLQEIERCRRSTG